MPKITYFEYRPGRWVKMVDGQAVGPAKPEEVAQWQREHTAQDNIWQDVVQKAAPSEPEQKAPPKRRAASTAPEDETTIWQDVVKADTAPEAKGPGPEPAEPASIWQDVVQRLGSAPSPPKLQPQEMPPADIPAAPITLAEAMEVAQRGQAVVVRAGKVARPGGKTAAPAGPPAPEAAHSATAEPKTETLSQAKIEPMPKRPTALESTPSAASPKSTPAAQAPAKEIAPKPISKPTSQEPTASKKTTRKPVTKPAAKEVTPEAAARPTSSRAAATQDTAQVEAKPPTQPPPQERPARPRTRATPARTPLETEPEPGLRPEPAEKAAELEQLPADLSPPAVRARPATKHRTSTATKRAGKTPTAALEEESSPSYLWIVAAATDDLVAAVRSGLARYQERTGEAAGAVLCHSEDLPGLEGARLPVDVREGKTLPRRNFWIGPK